ncbi:MAG: hemerythrin domain-containing protein [Candidatus Eisenbacteria bacterium]|nr:hemerythrin domain-containing protein [Candidatus Eisenbacteria bacterium]
MSPLPDASRAPGHTAPGFFDRLRHDHRRVLEQVAELEEEALGGRRRAARALPSDGALHRFAEMLLRQFDTHMAAEDELLFPALLAVMPEARDSVEPLSADHVELRGMLSRLRFLLGEAPSEPRDGQVRVLVADLVDLLRIHIRKEERAVFRVAQSVLDPAGIEALDAGLAVLELGTARRDDPAGQD